jgi:transcriptional regulator with XRE-family HTH domain
MIKEITNWQQWVTEAQQSPEFAAEQVKLDFAVALERRMSQQGITRAELARKLGTSAAAITQTLRGDANLSIERMARLAQALDAALHVHLAPVSSQVRWLETHGGNKLPAAQLNHARAWAQHSIGANHDRQCACIAA